jgi:hypothetical protein
MSCVVPYRGSAGAWIAAVMFALPALAGTAYAASTDSEEDAVPLMSVNPVEILADEKAAFSRLERCAEATPCDASACRSRYERRVLKELAQTRRIDMTAIMAKAIAACAERPAPRPQQQLEQAAKAAPAPTAATPPVAPAAVATTAAAVAIPPAPSAPPAPVSPAANPAVPPRVYYAVIQYDPSPQRDAEQQRGNCRNERVRITVTPDAQISWEIREATRTSLWQGRIDQATGEVAVQRDNVRIAPAGGVTERLDAASVSGRFARSRLTFSPCGAGYLLVNG